MYIIVGLIMIRINHLSYMFFVSMFISYISHMHRGGRHLRRREKTKTKRTTTLSKYMALLYIGIKIALKSCLQIVLDGRPRQQNGARAAEGQQAVDRQVAPRGLFKRMFFLGSIFFFYGTGNAFFSEERKERISRSSDYQIFLQLLHHLVVYAIKIILLLIFPRS